MKGELLDLLGLLDQVVASVTAIVPSGSITLRRLREARRRLAALVESQR